MLPDPWPTMRRADSRPTKNPPMQQSRHVSSKNAFVDGAVEQTNDVRRDGGVGRHRGHFPTRGFNFFRHEVESALGSAGNKCVEPLARGSSRNRCTEPLARSDPHYDRNLANFTECHVGLLLWFSWAAGAAADLEEPV
jgi:hypothetical protein